MHQVDPNLTRRKGRLAALAIAAMASASLVTVAVPATANADPEPAPRYPQRPPRRRRPLQRHPHRRHLLPPHHRPPPTRRMPSRAIPTQHLRRPTRTHRRHLSLPQTHPNLSGSTTRLEDSASRCLLAGWSLTPPTSTTVQHSSAKPPGTRHFPDSRRRWPMTPVSCSAG